MPEWVVGLIAIACTIVGGLISLVGWLFWRVGMLEGRMQGFGALLRELPKRKSDRGDG